MQQEYMTSAVQQLPVHNSPMVKARARTMSSCKTLLFCLPYNSEQKSKQQSAKEAWHDMHDQARVLSHFSLTQHNQSSRIDSCCHC